MTVALSVGVVEKRLAAPKAAAPAKAPKVEAEPVEEPVKRSSKKEEPAAPSKSVEALIDEWDDSE